MEPAPCTQHASQRRIAALTYCSRSSSLLKQIIIIIRCPAKWPQISVPAALDWSRRANKKIIKSTPTSATYQMTDEIGEQWKLTSALDQMLVNSKIGKVVNEHSTMTPTLAIYQMTDELGELWTLTSALDQMPTSSGTGKVFNELSTMLLCEPCCPSCLLWCDMKTGKLCSHPSKQNASPGVMVSAMVQGE